MPRVTISITAPEHASDSDLLSMELPPSLTIEDLKGLIEADKGYPAALQHIYLNGSPLNAQKQTLEEAGIHDGEMLAVVVRRRGNNQPPRQQQQQQQQQQHQHQQQRRPGVADPEVVRLRILGDPNLFNDLQRQNPTLAAAINDPARWHDTYYSILDHEDERERERQRQIALLNADPFDIDAQRKIEDIIRQEAVINNLQEALDENPEGESGPDNLLPIHPDTNAPQYLAASTCSMSTPK